LLLFQKKSRLPNLTYEKNKFSLATNVKAHVTGDGKLVVALVDECNSNFIAWDTATGESTFECRISAAWIQFIGQNIFRHLDTGNVSLWKE
jgi:hypothetical protein